nr:hypothetical protein [Bacillus tianshenii]
MKTGWLTLGGKKYYMDASGAMKIGWVELSRKWYYFYKDGSMAYNTRIGGYWLGSDGVWVPKK